MAKNDTNFGIFDSLEIYKARKNHLGRKIAEALMSPAGELLTNDLNIEFVTLLGVK